MNIVVHTKEKSNNKSFYRDWIINPYIDLEKRDKA